MIIPFPVFLLSLFLMPAVSGLSMVTCLAVDGFLTRPQKAKLVTFLFVISSISGLIQIGLMAFIVSGYART